MHCYKMEATVIENSESKIKSESEVKSKRKPPPGGIKKVRRFKHGHPYWGPQNAATSKTRQTNRSMWPCCGYSPGNSPDIRVTEA